MRLALESGSRLGSLAIAREDELLAECTLSVRASHSETLMPEVRRMLERCGSRVAEVEAVVVGAGPGSFTGVRIAAALAKGLCAATGAELFAYSSLTALAAGVPATDRRCALLPARGDEVFAAAYRTETFPEPVMEPRAAGITDVLARLDAGRADGAALVGWTFVGEGALRHAPRIREREGTVLPFPHAVPRAACLLWLARAHPAAGRVPDSADWEPSYVRDAGADRAALG